MQCLAQLLHDRKSTLRTAAPSTFLKGLVLAKSYVHRGEMASRIRLKSAGQTFVDERPLWSKAGGACTQSGTACVVNVGCLFMFGPREVDR